MLTIAHVAISVSSIERSAVFYGKCFGFRLVKTYPHTEIGLTIAVLKRGGIFLELFEFKRRRKLPAYRKDLDSDLRTLGVKHFSFAVTHIKEAYRKLKKRGVRFATPLRVFDDGKRYFFLKDPDGILVEIMEI